MDRHFVGFEWLPSQIQAVRLRTHSSCCPALLEYHPLRTQVNSLLIIVFIPLFNGFSLSFPRCGAFNFHFAGLYDLIHRRVRITSMRKVRWLPQNIVQT